MMTQLSLKKIQKKTIKNTHLLKEKMKLVINMNKHVFFFNTRNLKERKTKISFVLKKFPKNKIL